MATSTSTLLQVINRVLLNCNERTLTVSSTLLIGQQATECVRAAYYKLMRENEWQWNQQRVNASSWVGETATLATNTQRIKRVTWANSDGVEYPLVHLEQHLLQQYISDNYNSTTQTGRALFWTKLDYNTAIIRPYPNDATERAKIWFYITNIPTFPPNDASTFSIPEDIIPLLVLIATAMFLKRHADDLQTAQSFEQEYQMELQQCRARNMLVPQQGFNLYRGRKETSYDFS